MIPQGGEELEMGGFSWNGGASHTRASGGEEYPSAGPGGAASPGQREGLQSFPLPTAPKAHECLCRTHEILSPLCFTGGIFFPQLGIQLAAVFLQKVQELAGVGGVQPFPAPPRCWGKSHSSFFLAAECLFLCILQLAGTSSPCFLFTCLVISLVSGLLN